MNYTEWLHHHRQKFIDGDYTLREVLALSLAVGSWPLGEMRRALRHWPRGLWVTDPEASADRLAKQTTDHFEESFKRGRCLSLADQWRAVRDYQREGKTWEQAS